MSEQRSGVAEGGILLDVKRDLDDVVVVDALRAQVVAEEVKGRYVFPQRRMPVTTLTMPLCMRSMSLLRYRSRLISMRTSPYFPISIY